MLRQLRTCNWCSLLRQLPLPFDATAASLQLPNVRMRPVRTRLLAAPAVVKQLVLCRAMASAATGHTVDEVLHTLTNYEQQGIPANAGVAGEAGFDLQRMHRLLHVLGAPHNQWPRGAIHIAGSKGKGSTATLISHILTAAGFKVGSYTSPHLHHLRERIQLNCQPISASELDALAVKHRQTLAQQQQVEGGRLSHFEALTALAYRYFADAQVDVAVVETGMGGTTDATNVFQPDQLACSVITALGFEHVEALGGSLQSIATAKAGIMKAGRPVVVCRQQHTDALAVLQQEAARLECTLLLAQDQVQVQHLRYELQELGSNGTALRELIQLSFNDHVQNHSRQGSSALPAATELRTALAGPHQHDNIATAMTVCMQLREQGWCISEEALWQGLQSAYLPGRLQVLPWPTASSTQAAFTGSSTLATSQQQQPLYVVLDGAHSPESAASLAASIRAVFPDSPVALVVAMAADKEHRAVLTELQSCQPDVVLFTSVAIAGSYHRAASPGVLAAQWQAAEMLSRQPGQRRNICRQLTQASLQGALHTAVREVCGVTGGRVGRSTDGSTAQAAGAAPRVVVVTGSLHAVAAAQRVDELAALLARASHLEHGK